MVPWRQESVEEQLLRLDLVGKKKTGFRRSLVSSLRIDDNCDYDDFVYEDEDNEGDDADEEDV